MEDAILSETAAVERSPAPAAHKHTRCPQLRRHHAAVRACRRRIDASTMYRDAGFECATPAKIRDDRVEDWGHIFSRQVAHDRYTGDFLDHVQPAEMPTEWSWERGRPCEIAVRAKDTTPGLDGLGHTFWPNVSDEVLGIADDSACAATDGGTSPAALHDSRTVHIPKAELLADPADAHPTAAPLGLLRLLRLPRLLGLLRLLRLLRLRRRRRRLLLLLRCCASTTLPQFSTSAVPV